MFRVYGLGFRAYGFESFFLGFQVGVSGLL